MIWYELNACVYMYVMHKMHAYILSPCVRANGNGWTLCMAQICMRWSVYTCATTFTYNMHMCATTGREFGARCIHACMHVYRSASGYDAIRIQMNTRT
jgi:hypothetical protein